MVTAFKALFAYAAINFILFILAVPALLKTGEARVIRGFSGHWMLFYYIVFVVLYSAIHVSERDGVRRCSNNHVVEPAQRFCGTCGEDVGSALERRPGG